MDPLTCKRRIAADGEYADVVDVCLFVLLYIGQIPYLNRPPAPLGDRQQNVKV